MKNSNKTQEYDLTIVVRVYNEEDNLKRVEERLAAFLPKSPVSICVLLVNDGSTDHSLSLIKDICQRQKHFFLSAPHKIMGCPQH